MAPIAIDVASFDDSIRIYSIFTGAFVVGSSLVIFLSICTCCRRGKKNSAPAENMQEPVTSVRGEKSAKAMENLAEPASVVSTKQTLEMKTSQLEMSKKESPSVELRAKTSKISTPPCAVKTVVKMGALKSTMKTGKTAAITDQLSTSIVPAVPTVTPIVTRDTSVVSEGMVLQFGSITGEPTYPSEAASMENPAYDTIGSGFDDPFKQFSGQKPPIVHAMLVQPSMTGSSKQQSKSPRSTPKTTPSSKKTKSTAPSVEHKSVAFTKTRPTAAVTRATVAKKSTRAG